MIHAYHDRAINRALDAGVKCVEHGFLMGEATMERMVKEKVALSIQGKHQPGPGCTCSTEK